MAYEPKKDAILISWRIAVTDDQTAVVSLRQYNGGDPRLQIGPVSAESKVSIMQFNRRIDQ